MIYSLASRTLPWLAEAYERFMAQYRAFYESSWTDDTPLIYLVPDRATIDQLRGKKTEPWVVGWTSGRHVYLLDPEHYAAESVHAFSQASFTRLLGHELAHCFTDTVSGGARSPVWLIEGISIYLSGQLAQKPRPGTLAEFLDFHERGGKGVYSEAGLAVEFLVATHGRAKLLAVLRRAKSAPTHEAFAALFQEIYGFPLAYGEFRVLTS